MKVIGVGVLGRVLCKLIGTYLHPESPIENPFISYSRFISISRVKLRMNDSRQELFFSMAVVVSCDAMAKMTPVFELEI